MRHIGYKLLSGFIQRLHSRKHLVKCICDQSCLCIIRYRDLLILISVCKVLDCFRYPSKWLHQDRGKNITQKNGQHYNDTDDQNPFLLQFMDGCCHLTGRCHDHHGTLHLFYIRTFYRNCQDQLLAVRIILVGIFSFKTVQYFLGNQSPALIHAIGILDDPEIPVYNENPATIAVGQ